VTNVFTARHRFARITARKARYVADLIRGRAVNEALELLQFSPQRGAAFYLKVVRSAVANASLDENSISIAW
jgi:large subunit ribosomal protein L22